MDHPSPRKGDRLDFEEQEVVRRYGARLTDWSEPGVVSVCRDGRLLGPPMDPERAKLRKRLIMLP